MLHRSQDADICTCMSLISAAQSLTQGLRPLRFAPPITHVYNPLEYAWTAHEQYLQRYGQGKKRVLLVGMNPGPWGMAQTGVPFGEVAAVRDWLGICTIVNHPKKLHPQRPIQGFDCKQSEVSGRRLWGLMAERFSTPEAFFDQHFIANYCPLVFMEASGRNFTPDKLPAAAAAKLQALCDAHLQAVIQATDPEWVIGVGGYAEGRAEIQKQHHFPQIKLGRILHPSPASPAANRDWAGTAVRQLQELGVW
jgi:single-strand selective monofunctional uracil DNA glycosylase